MFVVITTHVVDKMKRKKSKKKKVANQLINLYAVAMAGKDETKERGKYLWERWKQKLQLFKVTSYILLRLRTALGFLMMNQWLMALRVFSSAWQAIKNETKSCPAKLH